MSCITQNFSLAVEQLQSGNVVAIPTETVYGLAGNAENERAIQTIFRMKNRPLTHPLIMHIDSQWDLNRWISFIPNYAHVLMERFWPGPLTLVLRTKPGAINPLVTGGQDTVALRCPAHPLAKKLLTTLQFPLVAPSANPFGKISPTTALHVQDSFKEEAFTILDGGRCDIGIESTIIDATDANGYKILRAGMIDEKMLETTDAHLRDEQDPTLRVSGNLDYHYQPEKPLYCFQNTEQLKEFCQTHTHVYVLSFNKDTLFKDYLGHQLSNSPHQLAYELYYELRRADASPMNWIAIELPPNEKLWQGIRERVLKAATNKKL